MVALLKDKISTPLEAGQSLLSENALPPLVHDALDFASKRLARKSLRLTLVTIHPEQQVPSTIPGLVATAVSPLPSPHQSPSAYMPLSASSASSSPAPFPQRMGFGASLKQRLRSAHSAAMLTLSSPTPDEITVRSAMTSPMSGGSLQTTSSDASSRVFAWPLSPSTTPRTPATPMTPSTVSSEATSSAMTDATDRSGLSSPGEDEGGVRLVYAEPVAAGEERVVRRILEKARRRYNVGKEWISPVLHPHEAGLTPSILHRSLVQNEPLFSSPGLTLLSLDRLFTFKTALSSYSRTGDASRLEDAVDELRRLYLAGGGRKVAKANVLRSYEWLAVSDRALSEADDMYRRAYGGPEGSGAIEGMGRSAPPAPLHFVPSTPNVVRERPVGILDFGAAAVFGLKEMLAGLDVEDDEITTTTLTLPAEIQISDDPDVNPTSSPPPQTTQSPTTPRFVPSSPQRLLPRLQTTFPRPRPQHPPTTHSEIQIHITADEEEEDLTARPISNPPSAIPTWPPQSALFPTQMTIDSVLFRPPSSGSGGRASIMTLARDRIGPMTPNGYDDISPVTRGEWGFLCTGPGWSGRRAAVETC